MLIVVVVKVFCVLFNYVDVEGFVGMGFKGVVGYMGVVKFYFGQLFEMVKVCVVFFIIKLEWYVLYVCFLMVIFLIWERNCWDVIVKVERGGYRMFFIFLVREVVGWLISVFRVWLLLNSLFFDVLILEFVSILVSLVGRLMFFSVVVKLVLLRFWQIMFFLFCLFSLVVRLFSVQVLLFVSL